MSSHNLNPTVTPTIRAVIGPREMHILRLLWQLGPSTVRTLHDHLNPLAYGTVLSICVRLVEKGLLERARVATSADGRSAKAYVYTPCFSEAQQAQLQLALRSTVPAPFEPTVNGADRDHIEQLLVYLGTLHDVAGERTSDTALELIAALLERAEAAERAAHALSPAPRKQVIRSPREAAPIHEYRGRMCRVCGKHAPPQSANRHDDLRVCRNENCRKEAKRRDHLANQLRYQHRKKQASQTAQQGA
jgi:predicted transcriptional regulator